eukprot:GDKK01026808.1.p1 GENE.GDKK01026808.1~~GDKK01026808.1.p1  ORF type:complete len:106 (-),score=10.85 GDKK01026808.1:154-471(-)
MGFLYFIGKIKSSSFTMPASHKATLAILKDLEKAQQLTLKEVPALDPSKKVGHWEGLAKRYYIETCLYGFENWERRTIIIGSLMATFFTVRSIYLLSSAIAEWMS